MDRDYEKSDVKSYVLNSPYELVIWKGSTFSLTLRTTGGIFWFDFQSNSLV